MTNNYIKKYLADIPCKQEGNILLGTVTKENVIKTVSSLYRVHRLPLLAIKAADERETKKGFVIYYIFGIPFAAEKIILQLPLGKELTFPSAIEVMYEASMYEQEIESFFGLTPLGHPFIQPTILHENWPEGVYPLRKDFPWNKKVKETNGRAYLFQQITGEGIYQIPVGPVHAGIIEPGHFRFSVGGEEILSLQPQLGYVHKGSEKLFEVLPLADKIKLSEHISGDTSFSHSLAFCQALETLSLVEVPAYAALLRVIFSELERLANHCNDIGFILNDTAFAFGGSNGPRLKEYVMQLNELLTGSRFLRGVNTLGGVTKDIRENQQEIVLEKMAELEKDFAEVVAVAEDNESVINRLKNTGMLDKQIALDHGVVGMAARQVGIEKDARIQYPYAGYTKVKVKMILQTTGDVYARYRLRIDEAFASMALIKEAIQKLKQEKVVLQVHAKSLAKNSMALSITEGWRGDIVYFVMTDNEGEISRVGVRDASFLNWPAVPYAVAKNIVPDFPLINKSFNLSYSGFDR